MDRDGTKDGYDLELTRAIAMAVGVPVIASEAPGRSRTCTRDSPPAGRMPRWRRPCSITERSPSRRSNRYLAGRGVLPSGSSRLLKKAHLTSFFLSCNQ